MFWSTSRSLAESTAMHSHEVAELILCRAGTGLLALDDRQLELAPRRSVLIAANVPHRFIFHEGEHTDLKFICVTNSDAALYLAPAQCSILQGAGKQGATGLAYTGSRQWLWELAEKIPESFGLDEPNELMELWGVIGLLIGAHAQAARAGADETTRGGGRHAETIRRICGWLDAHLDDSENLDDLAARFGLSRSLLTREFRTHTRTSVVDYVKTKRIQKAGALLAASGNNIAQVAAECGFCSLTYFYRQFKALYGITPAAFKKQFLPGANG